MIRRAHLRWRGAGSREKRHGRRAPTGRCGSWERSREGVFSKRYAAAYRRALAGGRSDLDLAPERGQPVLHVLQTRPGDRGAVEPDPIVTDLEGEGSVVALESNIHVGRERVFLCVLHRLEADEVHGRLGLDRETAEALGVDRDTRPGRDRQLLEGRADAALLQGGGIDPTRQIEKGPSRQIRLVPELAEHPRRLIGIALGGERLRETEVERQRRQALLRAVAEGALWAGARAAGGG